MDWKKLIINLFIPLAVGGLSAFLTRNSMELYSTINRPPLSPPGILFPIVWTILYFLMGISSYLICKSTSELKPKAFLIYGIQLFLNFLWTPVFFLGRNFLLSFIILLLLWYFVWLMIQVFSAIDKTAGRLQIPYLLWCTFAAYLNFAILLLNQ